MKLTKEKKVIKQFIAFENRIKSGEKIPAIPTTDFPKELFDWITDFCEKNDFIKEFVGCKLNPWAFYALCKYRINKNNKALMYEDVIKHLEDSHD